MYSIACGVEPNPKAPLPFAGDFCDCIRKAKSYGYDAIEIHTPDIDKLDVDSILRCSKENNVFISTLGTGSIYGKYGLSLMDQECDRHDTIIKMAKSFIDVAEKLGSKVTIGSIKGNIPKNGPTDTYINTLGTSLKELSEYAVKKGVIILLEATNRYENNVINTAKDIVSMIDSYSLENVQCLMDSFHINIEEANISHCLFDAGKYLGHIHFGDNQRGYPGSGSFNWDLFCNEIKATGYDGVLSVECLPLPTGDIVAENTIEFFRKNFG